MRAEGCVHQHQKQTVTAPCCPPEFIDNLINTLSTASDVYTYQCTLILVCYMKHIQACSVTILHSIVGVFSMLSQPEPWGETPPPPASCRLVDRACGISQRPPHACFLL